MKHHEKVGFHHVFTAFSPRFHHKRAASLCLANTDSSCSISAKPDLDPAMLSMQQDNNFLLDMCRGMLRHQTPDQSRREAIKPPAQAHGVDTCAYWVTTTHWPPTLVLQLHMRHH